MYTSGGNGGGFLTAEYISYWTWLPDKTFVHEAMVVPSAVHNANNRSEAIETLHELFAIHAIGIYSNYS